MVFVSGAERLGVYTSRRCAKAAPEDTGVCLNEGSVVPSWLDNVRACNTCNAQ